MKQKFGSANQVTISRLADENTSKKGEKSIKFNSLLGMPESSATSVIVYHLLHCLDFTFPKYLNFSLDNIILFRFNQMTRTICGIIYLLKLIVVVEYALAGDSDDCDELGKAVKPYLSMNFFKYIFFKKM
jgi:hypothetical protein